MKKDKIAGNEGAKILSSISHSGNEGARTKDRWEHFGNEGAKNEKRKYSFLIKLINVDIDALFEPYLAIICSVCINTLHIAHEKALFINLFNMWSAKFWQI